MNEVNRFYTSERSEQDESPSKQNETSLSECNERNESPNKRNETSLVNVMNVTNQR